MNMQQKADRLCSRIAFVEALAARTPFEEEANTALKLAAVLRQQLQELHDVAVTEAEKKHSEPQNYYRPDTHTVQREPTWSLYWMFDRWGTRYTEERSAHSGDSINRDFSAWIGRKCSTDEQFRQFWNEMSKAERKLWRETHWRPPVALPGSEGSISIYSRGRWQTKIQGE